MVDHYLIFAVRKINAKRLLNKQTKIFKTCSLRSYDKQLFLDERSTFDWDKAPASTNGNPDFMASVCNSAMSALLEVHAPLKCTKITSPHAPWITVDLKILMKKRDLAEKKPDKDSQNPIGQSTGNYETKLLMSFVKGCRTTTITSGDF